MELSLKKHNQCNLSNEKMLLEQLGMPGDKYRAFF